MKFILRCLLCAMMSLEGYAAHANDLLVHTVDTTGKPLTDVVVYAEPLDKTMSKITPKAMPSTQIEQKDLKFIPLVTVIQTGSRVFFPNHDKVQHNIYSVSAAKHFEQKLYSGQSAAPQVFDQAGTVVLGCNIHDSMMAYIQVVDTPFFAKTDATGIAHLDLPTGKYLLKAWYYNMLAKAPLEQPLQNNTTDSPIHTTFKIALKPPVVVNGPSDSSDY